MDGFVVQERWTWAIKRQTCHEEHNKVELMCYKELKKKCGGTRSL